MGRKQSNRGVTLVEAVAAIVVLGIAIPPLVALFSEVAMRSPDHTYQQAALAYADNLMEEIVSKEFEDPDLASGSFGTEEGTRADYDDVDDYDGSSNSPPRHFDGTLLDEYADFTRSVVVENVTAADPDPTGVQPDGSTEFKRIRVTVAWTGARGGEVTISTLRTKLVLPTIPPPPPPPPITNPLDEVASAASAVRTGRRVFEIDLVSISPTDVVIESFSLSSDAGSEELRRLRLDGNKVWQAGGVFLPTGTTALNQGTTADRTILAGTSPTLRVEFRRNQSGTVEYTLVLGFTNGSSSTMVFTINW